MTEPTTRTVSFGRTLAAPWLGILRPSLAGAWMANGSRAAFSSSFLLGLALLTLLHFGLQLWSQTYQLDWSGVTGGGGAASRPVLHETPLDEAWTRWRKAAGFEPLLAVAVIVIPVVLVSAGVLAWLLLPEVHAGGAIWPSYKRAFCGVAGSVGFLTLGSLLIGSAVNFAQQRHYRQYATAGFSSDRVLDPIMCIVTAMLIAGGIWPFWLARAARGARGSETPAQIPPRCEACGYDLTHVPDSGICPECGVDVTGFLTPQGGRCGTDYENRWGWRHTADPWLRSTFKALFTPSRFYSQLQLRTPEEPARRFAAWHFAAVGCCAFIWSIILSYREITHYRTLAISERFLHVATETLCLSIMVAMLTLVAAWLLHRFVAAVEYTHWLFTGSLADPRWARKIAAYEAVYLWPAGILTGLLITNFKEDLGWIPVRWLRPLTMFFGMPTEVSAFLLLIGLLALVWMWRYQLAMRRIRYSNF